MHFGARFRGRSSFLGPHGIAVKEFEAIQFELAEYVLERIAIPSLLVAIRDQRFALIHHGLARVSIQYLGLVGNRDHVFSFFNLCAPDKKLARSESSDRASGGAVERSSVPEP